MIGARIVTVDGNLLDDALIEEVQVVQELNQHWWCDVTCRQTRDKRLPAEDMLGKTLSVAAKTADGSQVTIFAGLIIESELDYEIWGSAGARLRAVTVSYLLDLTPRRAYYPEKAPQAIASQLVSVAGLQLQGSLDGPTLSYVQMGENDFSFILRLADGCEKWLRPTGDGLEVQGSFSSGATVKWRDELGLRQFAVSGRVAAAKQTGAHYDYRHMDSRIESSVKDDAAFYGSAARMVSAVKSQAANAPTAYVPQRERLLGTDDVQPLLKKESRRSQLSAVLASGVSREIQLKAGDEVTIEGVLDANGVYGLVRVTHHWTSTGYENQFLCTPAQKYVPLSAPRTPKFAGIVPARVADNNDPQRIGRLQIQFFWQEENRTCWVRWMTPHAGADRGILFLPEVGDEVWIMFEEGDPERPRIVGCTWNGVHKPPHQDLWGGDTAPNDVKRMVTKSGHRISLSDKSGKNAIVVATPNHVKMSLMENSNETSDSMLTLHSDGDIFLDAPNGRVHFHSKFLSREVGDAGMATQAPAAMTPSQLELAAVAPHHKLSSSLNAMVLVLNLAAQTGKPFCEICAKKLMKAIGE